MQGILPLYSKFIRSLKKDRFEIAHLQALGRLEEYFTKRFASVIFTESKFSVLPLTNLGNRGEPKIDIACLEGSLSQLDLKHRAFKKELAIRSFVELKYLRNRHRIGSSAEDEITTILADLRRQLKFVSRKRKHALYRVDLRAKQKNIYGVVFASYLRACDEEDKEKQFRERILEHARKMGFKWHDYQRPYLHPVYSGKKIEILKRSFSVSLYHGIWRI